MWCMAATSGDFVFPCLRIGAINAKCSTVNISGKTSFVNNSATSDMQDSTGGGQIVEHVETPYLS